MNNASNTPHRRFKRFLGQTLFSICNGWPRAKPLLRGWGLRTTEDWFSSKTARVQFGNGRELRLQSLENYLSFELFWRGGDYYEPISRMLAERLSDESSLFIDAGANIGFYTLVLAKRRPELQVVSFEPNPRINTLLSRNVAANGLANVRCEAIALSDQTGTGRFFLDDSDMSASLEPGFSGAPADVVEVATSRLDDYVQKQTVKGRILMKVDVEGHETAFFNGASEIIHRHKPDIIAEVTASYDREIERRLRAEGYHFYPITDRGAIAAEHIQPVVCEPLVFLNYLLSARPHAEVVELFESIRPAIATINLLETSKRADVTVVDRLRRGLTAIATAFVSLTDISGREADTIRSVAAVL